MGTNRDDEIEIDLKQLFFVLRRRAWAIILAVLIGASVSLLYTTTLMEPVYTSSTMIYILNKTDTLTSLSDLQLGTQLTKDYKILVTSSPVMEQVIYKLGLNMTEARLKSKISIANPEDTRILTISVRDTNPEMACAIVDAVAEVSVERIADIMDSKPPKIVEEGKVPTVPTSPNVKKNTALGGILAGILAIGVVTVLFVLNDSIKSTADIERYLELNTLGAIPSYANQDKRKKKGLLQRIKRKGLNR